MFPDVSLWIDDDATTEGFSGVFNYTAGELYDRRLQGGGVEVFEANPQQFGGAGGATLLGEQADPVTGAQFDAILFTWQFVAGSGADVIRTDESQFEGFDFFVSLQLDGLFPADAVVTAFVRAQIRDDTGVITQEGGVVTTPGLPEFPGCLEAVGEVPEVTASCELLIEDGDDFIPGQGPIAVIGMNISVNDVDYTTTQPGFLDEVHVIVLTDAMDYAQIDTSDDPTPVQIQARMRDWLARAIPYVALWGDDGTTLEGESGEFNYQFPETMGRPSLLGFGGTDFELANGVDVVVNPGATPDPFYGNPLNGGQSINNPVNAPRVFVGGMPLGQLEFVWRITGYQRNVRILTTDDDPFSGNDIFAVLQLGQYFPMDAGFSALMYGQAFPNTGGIRTTPGPGEFEGCTEDVAVTSSISGSFEPYRRNQSIYLKPVTPDQDSRPRPDTLSTEGWIRSYTLPTVARLDVPHPVLGFSAHAGTNCCGENCVPVFLERITISITDIGGGIQHGRWGSGNPPYPALYPGDGGLNPVTGFHPMPYLEWELPGWQGIDVWKDGNDDGSFNAEEDYVYPTTPIYYAVRKNRQSVRGPTLPGFSLPYFYVPNYRSDAGGEWGGTDPLAQPDDPEWVIVLDVDHAVYTSVRPGPLSGLVVPNDGCPDITLETPDDIETPDDLVDFFVTVLPDSGYITYYPAGGSGDGTSIEFGADFRAYVDVEIMTDDNHPLNVLARQEAARTGYGTPENYKFPGGVLFSRPDFPGASGPAIDFHLEERDAPVSSAVLDVHDLVRTIPSASDYSQAAGPYETVPFFLSFDADADGPRSPFFPVPPTLFSAPPFLSPISDTWWTLPGLQTVAPTWTEERNFFLDAYKHRVMSTRVDKSSEPMPVFGINVCSTTEPIGQDIFIEEITAAVVTHDYLGQEQGRGFEPSDLMPISPDGTGPSGISLYMDDKTYESGEGWFNGADTQVVCTGPSLSEEIVPIDLDGIAFQDRDRDGVPDVQQQDRDGDGNPDYPFNDPDPQHLSMLSPDVYGHVITFRPVTAFPLPPDDIEHRGGEPVEPEWPVGDTDSSVPNNAGDDLFIVVRTSDTISFDDRIEIAIPFAGIVFNPTGLSPASGSLRHDVELGFAQNWGGKGSPFNTAGVQLPVEVSLGDDVTRIWSISQLRANVPTDLHNLVVPDRDTNGDLVPDVQELQRFCGPIPVIGLDIATLLDDTNVFSDTYFEQLTAEFYNIGEDQNFNAQVDLVPFTTDSATSGVGLYVDNDADPGNTNGVFDPDIDLPVQFDDVPDFIGVAGEAPTQVRMVFSSPGVTPDFSKSQTPGANYDDPGTLRLPVPATFGRTDRGVPIPGDPDYGDDFFLVLRSSGEVEANDDFSVGIVSWGPGTPTAPDPDIFTAPPAPLQPSDEYEIFDEHPWGLRGIGFVTLLPGVDDPPKGLGPETNNNLRLNYYRSRSFERIQSAGFQVVPGTCGAVGDEIQIEDVYPSLLARVTPPNGSQTFLIFGRGFGSTPTVTLGGANITVLYSGGTLIVARIPGGTTLSDNLLEVTNDAGNSDTDNVLITLVDAVPPTITSVTPGSGRAGTAVTIRGMNFESNADVFFGGTPRGGIVADNIDVDLSGAEITCNAPAGLSGPQPVRVENTTTGLIAISYPIPNVTEPDNYEGGFVYTGAGPGLPEPGSPPTVDGESLIIDNYGFLPNNVPLPLYGINASFEPVDADGLPLGVDEVLDSVTVVLLYPDNEDNEYWFAPIPSDIEEVTLWVDGFSTAEDYNGQFVYVEPEYRSAFDDQPVASLPGSAGVYTFGGLAYTFQNIGQAIPVNDEGLYEGNDFFVTFSSSSVLRNYDFWLLNITSGYYGVAIRGSLEDVELQPYQPDDVFEPVTSDTDQYISQFVVFDATPGPFWGDRPAWTYFRPGYPGWVGIGVYHYTTPNEMWRPRWDSALDPPPYERFWNSNQQSVLIPLEQPYSVIGIDVHGGDGDEDRIYPPGNIYLDEITVAITDIGGDPDRAGSGGFNPITGLDPIQWGFTAIGAPPWNGDVTFSGIAVWQDTNGNGDFDPPTFGGEGQVELVDLPYDFYEFPTWEYLADPDPAVEGEDPQWRITLRPWLVREPPDQQPEISAVPAGGDITVEDIDDRMMDLFVVIRADSGFTDASDTAGDGQGIEYGADIRAFVPPMEINPITGQLEGGIRFSSMRAPSDFAQITLREDWARPAKAVVEIHDWVQSFTSNNDFAFDSGASAGGVEAAPFFIDMFDMPPQGPRSVFFPNPPPSPFSMGFQPRLLIQRVEANSDPVCMLGINVVNTPDPITTAINDMFVQSITVALVERNQFPENEFDANFDIMAVSPDGLGDSGISLWADNTDPAVSDIGTFWRFEETRVPFRTTGFSETPQPIDLDGDNVADIDGYLITLQLTEGFQVPPDDNYDGLGLQVDVSDGNHGGDDLFICVQTSSNITFGDGFEMVLPAGGIDFRPAGRSNASASRKYHPDEPLEGYDDWINALGGFFDSEFESQNAGTARDHGALNATVAAALTDLTMLGQQIPQNSEPTAVIGFDMSTQFEVAPPFESYFEYLLVEFYNKGTDTDEDGRVDDQDFDPRVDLMPFSTDSSVSGVALYRDNDDDAGNTNGVFDPDIDTPVTFDDPPDFVGVSGEPPMQVRMVFSSPGTDDLAGTPSGPTITPQGSQPQLRQLIPDGTGRDALGAPIPGHPDYGDDFFLVLRTSQDLRLGDDFSVAIVSWGPPTPTAPDPDTFTSPPAPTQPSDEFDIFQDFPWGNQAIGFVTVFPPLSDPSGYDFFRSTSQARMQTNTLTGILGEIVEPGDLSISGVFPTTVGRIVPNEGRLVIGIQGTGFAIDLTVTIGGVVCDLLYVTETLLIVGVPAGSELSNGTIVVARPEPPASVEASLTIVDADQPVINSVRPGSGDEGTTVTITGGNFDDDARVIFGDLQTGTLATDPVVQSNGTLITVTAPFGVGAVPVAVENPTTGLIAISYPIPDPGEPDGYDGGFLYGEGPPLTEPGSPPSLAVEELVPSQGALMPNTEGLLFGLNLSFDPVDADGNPLGVIEFLDSITVILGPDSDFETPPWRYPQLDDFAQLNIYRDGLSIAEDRNGVFDLETDELITSVTSDRAVRVGVSSIQFTFENIAEQLPLTDEGLYAGNDYFVTIVASPDLHTWVRFAASIPVGRAGIIIGPYEPDAQFEGVEGANYYAVRFGVYDATPLALPELFYETYASLVLPGEREVDFDRYLYVPPGEFERPRPDSSVEGIIQQFEFPMQQAQLLPMEQWTEVIAIDAHGGSAEDPMFIDSVTVALTDIGADVLPAGNGGFNPLTGLDPILGGGANEMGIEDPWVRAVVFSGIALYRDTNNNGVFDAPTSTGLSGDEPCKMWPTSFVYLPDPDPTVQGDDPQWRITLQMSNTTLSDPLDPNEAWLEPSADFTGEDQPLVDFFVVVRADSGFNDVSGVPGDGTGIEFGADFRAFVPPPEGEDVLTGGITFTSATRISALREPFVPSPFPQRTLPELCAKPVTAVVDLHDLVLTYPPVSGFANIPFEFSKVDEVLGSIEFVDGGAPCPCETRFSYETVPFLVSQDLPPFGPRSIFYPNPPPQLSIPFGTGEPGDAPPAPITSAIEDYARARNFDADARILSQRIDADSPSIPILGLNVVNTADENTLEFNNLYIESIAVAFLGNDGFDPLADLKPLTTDGLSESGVSLWLDNATGDSIGVFSALDDTQVELFGPQFSQAPVPVDIDGDGLADIDEAWVVTLKLMDAFQLPPDDIYDGQYAGDDLFVVVRTSENLGYRDEFEAVMPAGGIIFNPTGRSPASATQDKTHPEEGAKPFYELTRLPANVPVTLTDLTSPVGNITPSSIATPIIGIDAATLNPDVEVYLEQLVVEIYNQGPDTDGDGRVDDQDFNPTLDLMPFSANGATSGMAIYRDNDADPNNVNGVFDAADTPLTLDDAPDLIGVSGEPPIQVRMVFSSPGTDDIAGDDDVFGPGDVPMDQQPQLRQLVATTRGTNQDDPDYGDDFFVVMRTSPDIEVGDDFSAGIVSWGPDTPSGPDPDTFTAPAAPVQPSDEFDIFMEIPFGSRAIGFIEILPDDGDPDTPDFIRTSSQQRMETRILTTASSIGPGPDPPPGGPITITSVVPSTLARNLATTAPTQVLIFGSGFAPPSAVTVGGVPATVWEPTASDRQLLVDLPAGSVLLTDIVSVTNSVAETATTRVNIADGVPPTITAIVPNSGSFEVFPVQIHGTWFGGVSTTNVTFGNQLMPISSLTTMLIAADFPSSGLQIGLQPVLVTDTVTGLSALSAPKIDAFGHVISGFNFLNQPDPVRRPCFVATAAYGTGLADELETLRAFRDETLLTNAVGAALVKAYYAVSPKVADFIGDHTLARLVVRVMLKPAVFLAGNGLFGVVCIVACLALAFRSWRRRRSPTF